MTRAAATDGLNARPVERTDALIVLTSAGRRGAELEGVDLAAELQARGRRAAVVALTEGGGGLRGIEALGSSRLAVRTLRELRARAAATAVVIAYGSTTLPASALALVGAQTPFVYRSIGEPGEWVRGRLHQMRTRVLYRQAEHVVALWPGAARQIRDLYSTPSDRLTVIPNARDGRRFVPATPDQRRAARAAWGIHDARPVVVWMGSLSPEKQPERAIEVMDRLPDAHLLIAGDGSERAAVDERVRSSTRANVSVVGVVDDPRTVLHAADVLLLTSRTEGMPGVVIEAGLCGVPAVAPPIGAIPELIDDNVTGILTPDEGSTAVAAAVAEALGTRDEFGAAADTKMRGSFTWDVVAPAWIELLAGLSARA